MRLRRVLPLILLIVLLSVPLIANAQGGIAPKASDVLYAGDSQPADLLDVYVPENETAPYPVVVMYTVSTGDKNALNDFGVPQFVVEQGYAVVTVGYRGVLPVTYDDAFCALAWVYTNAAQYNLDTSRIALYGVSWGGVAAATVANTDDATPYLTDCPNSLPADHALRGVITNSGAFFTVPDEITTLAHEGLYPDFAKFDADTVQKTVNALNSITPDQWCCLFFPMDVHDVMYQLPVFHVTNHEPPFLIVQGLADTTVPFRDALNYATALLGLNNDVQLVFDAQSGHIVELSVYQEQMTAFLKWIFS